MGRKRTLPDPDPRPCLHCRSMFTPRRKSPARIYCSVACQRAAVLDHSSERQRERGKKAGAANIERLRGTGTAPGRYVKENGRHQHRVVAERMLGRPLMPGEIVHHINNDPRDNRPENLVVLRNQGDHARLHAALRKR